MDFRDSIRQKALEDRETEERHRQINAIILRELPTLFENTIRFFINLVEDTPINVTRINVTKQLMWAYGNEYIGEINVIDYSFTLTHNSMTVSLNPVVGYVGATAKIDINASGFIGLPINKNGIFIDVAYAPDQRNAIKYMDLNNRVHEFNGTIAEQILSTVFLGQSR